VADGYHLWSENYDRQLEDVFAIQDEISRAIVEALKLRLGADGGQLVAPTRNLEAYTLYLKGRFFFNKDTEPSTRKALDFFQQSLLQDPGYARSYAGIADCWTQLADDFVVPDDAYPRARAAATRALEHDPDLVEALTSVGKVLCWYEWDFTGSEQRLRRAVSLNDNYAEAHGAYGSVLPTVGRLAEAVGEMRRALVLDPLNAVYSQWLERFLLFSGDYAGTIAQARQTLDLSGDYPRSYLDIGSAYLGLGDPETALQWFQRGQGLESSIRSYDALIVRALAPLGRREEADEILGRLEDQSRQHYVRSEIMAMGYAALGNPDRAFACLERAFQARSAGLIYLHLDPGYQPLRTDPRFAQLVERIGLSHGK
jgi:tetratricopeptide (TPR) repeat protein